MTLETRVGVNLVEYYGLFGVSTRLFERARTNLCANLSFYTRSASDSDCTCALRAATFVKPVSDTYAFLHCSHFIVPHK